MDFPTGPTLGQQYTFAGRTWAWNGEGWVRLVNYGQAVSVFVPLEAVIQLDLLVFPAGPANPFVLLNTV
jgi:hypothetical protein